MDLNSEFILLQLKAPHNWKKTKNKKNKKQQQQQKKPHNILYLRKDGIFHKIN